MNNYIKFVAFAAIVASPTLVLAHTGATGIVKQGMDTTKDVGAVMKELDSMVKGEADFDETTVARRAGALDAAGKTCKSCQSDYRKP